MREIKFRGKLKEKGMTGWIEGSLVHITRTYKDEEDEQECDIYQIINNDGVGFFIDKETIGQFTGLHDKNGKEIYEGDILQQVHYVFSNDEYDHKGFKKFIIQVLWGQKEAAFIFKVIKEIDIEMPKDYKEPYREVIGNIYENVDLLKGADNIE